MDFWNNPILATAVRARFRGGYLIHALVLYPLLLMMAGASVPFFFHDIPEWPRYGFNVLIIVQFGLCGLIATASASHSLKAEVVNQTLDFLRMTPLSPWQILTGKMIGECSFSFFLAVASFPVGVLCWSLGGVELLPFLLLYLNLFVYVPLCASSGLVMRVETREDRRVEGISFLAFAGWGSALPPLVSLALDPAIQCVLLVLVPPLMILATFFNLHVMTRSLASPFNPPVSKRLAYGVLLASDLIAAVVLSEIALVALPFELRARSVVFWAVHLIVSTYLIIGVTPWREALRTWVWRFRGRGSPLRDAWLGDRSANGPAVLTFAGIGLLVFGGVFVPLSIVAEGLPELRRSLPALWGSTALSLVLLLTFGFIFQWNSLIFGRTGSLIVVVFMGALMAPAYLGMVEPSLMWVLELSPLAYYAYWCLDPNEIAKGSGRLWGDSEPHFFWVVLLAWAAVAFLAHNSVRARLRWFSRVVDRKLEKMGVSSQ
jgi:hypothetical protein